ncbi:hypothetical protein LguiA_035031 [Lonicera macranthoides]
MPVFGREEPAAFARQSSNNNAGAGVPIKKRRFPPPPQEPSSLHEKSDSVDKQHPCGNQGSSLMNATVASTSVGKFDAINNSLLEVKKELVVDPNCNLVQTSVNVSVTIPKEPNLAAQSDLIEKSPPNLAPKETHADVGKKVVGKSVSMNCKPEPFLMTGCDEFPLGPKLPLVSALMGQNREGCLQMPDNLYPSLSLSLSKEKCADQSKSVDTTAIKDSVVSANRSNWDLNTTMDAWEGSVGDTPPLDTVDFHGLNKTGGSLDINPSLVSRSELGVSVDSGKQILGAGDSRPNFPVSSLPPSQFCKAEDLLHLSLSPSFTRTNFGEHFGSSSANLHVGSSSANVSAGSTADIHSGSSANVTSSRAVAYSKLPGQLVSTKNSSAGINVKPEPFDGSAKHDSGEGKGNSLGSSSIIKREVVEKCSTNDFNLSNAIPKVVEPKLVKSEPTQDSNKETLKLTEATLHGSVGAVLQRQQNVSPITGVPLIPEKSCSSGLPTCSELSNQSEHTAKQVAMLPTDLDGNVNLCRAEDSNVGELPHSHGNTEALGSDEEKVNISTDMMEEDSYGSDCESDGKEEGTRGGKEEDEYEDGEVRESVVQNTTLNVPTDEREENNANRGDCENSNLNSSGLMGNENINQNPVDDDKDREEVCEDHIKECVDSGVNDTGDQISDKGVCFQEPLTVEVAAARAEAESPTNATERRLTETDVLSDGGTNGGKGTETDTAVGEVANENANGNDEREKDDSYLLMSELALNGQDSAKDTDSGGGSSRSRIINLPRASNVVSPTKTRSIPDRVFLSGTGKERFANFEGEKLHPRRNRDEMYDDGPRRFARDRFQDQSFRGSRTKFVRGRGRAYNRFDRSEWVSDRKFIPENYNGPADYRFPRNKHVSVGDDELESDGYAMAPDGALVGGTGRGGRKPLSDDFPSYRHQAPRRLSPRGRGGPLTRGIPSVRRITRNISPSGEGEFIRGVPDDIIDPMFAHSQHPNEGLEGQFVRGNRKFSSIQRRGLPRVRSKSPMRTRTRSPGPWSSPRRRSPDGYNGIQELTRQRRSPPIYRMERIRSPPLNFPEEMVARRRGSPPYISRPNDLQLHNNQRPIINRRSPSDRPIPRNNRRFDTSLDPQERTNSGEYFEGPMRATRFHELGEDRSGGDDRRKLGDRRGGRGPSFRPSFNGGGGENFRFHPDGGHRPFRFCPEGDSEFVERSSNLREREFDRRIKNRPVITPRRIRGIEEQEGDFRQGGPVWQDDGFGDASRGKRRRF